MDIKTIVVSQLMLFSFREGERISPGSYEAKVGVAEVIRNRVQAGWHNGDWLKIISESPINSSSNLDQMDWKSYVDIWSPLARRLYFKCEELYGLPAMIRSDSTQSPDLNRFVIGGAMGRPALYYGSLQLPIRPWFKEHIIDMRSEHPITTTIGLITFFA